MKTDLVTAATTARRQRVVIEYREVAGGPEWWVMQDDGRIEVFDTSAAALASVRRRASRGNKGVTVTAIEWRDTPAGFTPPAK